MMYKTFSILVLIVLLPNCAPNSLGGSSFGGESWGKAMFSPSNESVRVACETGFKEGQTKKQIKPVGAIFFHTPKGVVLFQTRLGGIYTGCNSDGAIGAKSISANYSNSSIITEVRFTDERGTKEAKVSFSLEDEQGKEIARLNAVIIELKLSYAPKSYSNADIAALNKTKSFTIIINRGISDERYKVAPSFTPLSPIQQIK